MEVQIHLDDIVDILEDFDLKTEIKKIKVENQLQMKGI